MALYPKAVITSIVNSMFYLERNWQIQTMKSLSTLLNIPLPNRVVSREEFVVYFLDILYSKEYAKKLFDLMTPIEVYFLNLYLRSRIVTENFVTSGFRCYDPQRLTDGSFQKNFSFLHKYPITRLFAGESQVHSAFITGEFEKLFPPFELLPYPDWSPNPEQINKFTYSISRNPQLAECFDMVIDLMLQGVIGPNYLEMSKTEANQIVGQLPYSEIFLKSTDFNIMKDTFYLYQFIHMILVSGVLKYAKSSFVIGENYELYKSLSNFNKIKFFYDNYMKYVLNDYEEVEYLFGEYRVKCSDESFHKFRENIAGEIKRLKPNTYYQGVYFLDYIHYMKRIHLPEKVLNSTVFRRGTTWKYADSTVLNLSIASIFLTRVLGFFGIIETHMQCTQKEGAVQFYPLALKVTGFGHALLNGLEYEEPISNQIIVQSNYDIIVYDQPGNGCIKEYLNQFFVNSSSDPNVHIYTLDFAGIVKARKYGVSPNAIRKMLSFYCTLPQNVNESLLNWERQLKKVRIRTMTVIESDDAMLLEEIKNYKEVKEFLVPSGSVVEINPAGISKIEKSVFKNKRLIEVQTEKNK